MESKHTKGKAEMFEYDTVSIDGYSVVRVDSVYRILDDWGEKGLRHWSEGNGKIDISDEEAEANAKLIADAFNVTHETGLTPRELQKELETWKRRYKEVEQAIRERLSNQ